MLLFFPKGDEFMNIVKHLLILAEIFKHANESSALVHDSWEEDKHPRDRSGRFTNGDRHEDIFSYNRKGEVSATESHKFPTLLFGTKQNFKNHFKNHRTDLLKAGIHNEAEYERESRRVIESPVGGNIEGHVASVSKQEIVRYDKRINLFVKGNPQRRVFTSFVPSAGIRYYYEKREEDLCHDGKE